MSKSCVEKRLCVLLSGYGQFGCVLQAELQKSFAGDGDLFALFRGGHGGPGTGTGECADAGTFATARYATDEGA